jgi:hypothetical protein
MGLAQLQLDPGRANHVFCCGRKGSGKSVLAELFWRSYPYDRLVIDPTGDVDAGPDAVDLETPLPTRWPSKLGRDRRQTFRFAADPGSPTFRDDMDRAVGLAFAHGRCLLWLDEVGELTSANRTTPAMARVLHQARHRKLSTLFCGPRPIDINPLVISQADYVAVFDLPNPADRKRVADVCGIPLEDFEAALADATAEKHGFVWWDTAERELLIMPPLPAGAVQHRRQPGDRFRDDLEPDLT